MNIPRWKIEKCILFAETNYWNVDYAIKCFFLFYCWKSCKQIYLDYILCSVSAPRPQFYFSCVQIYSMHFSLYLSLLKSINLKISEFLQIVDTSLVQCILSSRKWKNALYQYYLISSLILLISLEVSYPTCLTIKDRCIWCFDL